MGVYYDFGDFDFGLVKSLDGFSLGGDRFFGRFEKLNLLLFGEFRFSEREVLNYVDNMEGFLSGYGDFFEGLVNKSEGK